MSCRCGAPRSHFGTHSRTPGAMPPRASVCFKLGLRDTDGRDRNLSLWLAPFAAGGWANWDVGDFVERIQPVRELAEDRVVRRQVHARTVHYEELTGIGF